MRPSVTGGFTPSGTAVTSTATSQAPMKPEEAGTKLFDTLNQAANDSDKLDALAVLWGKPATTPLGQEVTRLRAALEGGTHDPSLYNDLCTRITNAVLLSVSRELRDEFGGEKYQSSDAKVRWLAKQSAALTLMEELKLNSSTPFSRMKNVGGLLVKLGKPAFMLKGLAIKNADIASAKDNLEKVFHKNALKRILFNPIKKSNADISSAAVEETLAATIKAKRPHLDEKTAAAFSRLSNDQKLEVLNIALWDTSAKGGQFEELAEKIKQHVTFLPGRAFASELLANQLAKLFDGDVGSALAAKMSAPRNVHDSSFSVLRDFVANRLRHH